LNTVTRRSHYYTMPVYAGKKSDNQRLHLQGSRPLKEERLSTTKINSTTQKSLSSTEESFYEFNRQDRLIIHKVRKSTVHINITV
jgi:hypothetical protein